MALSSVNASRLSAASTQRSSPVCARRPQATQRLRVAPIVAFRDSKKNTTQSKSTKAQNNNKSTNKQPLIPGFGKAPSNERENAESVLWFVAVAGFFFTGVLFVTIPFFQVGGNAFTRTWQSGVNKSVGIKEPIVAGKGYAPGPGPAAAPESPAAKM